MAEVNTANQSEAITPATPNTAAANNSAAQAQSEAAQAAAKAVAETFELKVNGETKQVTKDDLIALAQKGSDYDRIRKGYDFVKTQAEKDGEQDVGKWLEKQNVSKVEIPESVLTSDEKASLEHDRDALYTKLVDEGTNATMAQVLANSEMERNAGKLLDSKKLTAKQEAKRKAEMDAALAKVTPLSERIKVLEAENATLKAEKDAKTSNAAAAAASVGPLVSEAAADPDFISSSDWDKATPEVKEKFLKDPAKLKKAMSKWGKK